MKFRIYLLFALVMFSFSEIYSQKRVIISTYTKEETSPKIYEREKEDNNFALRPCFVNLNFVSQKLVLNNNKFNSVYGGAFVGGRTFYVNRNKPLLQIIRFGVDVVWVDINFAHYSKTLTNGDEVEKKVYDLAEIGMHLGASMTISPYKGLHLNGYFRFAPSYAAFFYDRAYGGYAPMFLSGVNISYGAVGYGIEKRWGKCTYKPIGEEKDSGVRINSELSGIRFFMTFKF